MDVGDPIQRIYRIIQPQNITGTQFASLFNVALPVRMIWNFERKKERTNERTKERMKERNKEGRKGKKERKKERKNERNKDRKKERKKERT